MKSLIADRFMRVTHHAEHALLELEWEPATAEMSVAELHDALLRFAEAALEHHARALLVDVRAFGHVMQPETGRFRDAEIVPRYNEAGVRRFAFLHAEGAELPPARPADGPRYETRHWADRTAALNWALTGAALHITVEYRAADEADLDALQARVAHFVGQVRTRAPDVEYTSTCALNDARRFVHVIRVLDASTLTVMQGEDWFAAFAKFLRPQCAEAPTVTRYAVVASTS